MTVVYAADLMDVLIIILSAESVVGLKPARREWSWTMSTGRASEVSDERAGGRGDVRTGNSDDRVGAGGAEQPEDDAVVESRLERGVEPRVLVVDHSPAARQRVSS